jgi:membrane-associated protease RseP (regulator of RpoE activity)
MLMAVFILLMGVQHPPPLNDRTGLDVKRKVLAAVVLLVFIVTFVPRPIIG